MSFPSMSISIYYFKHPQTCLLKTVTNVNPFKLILEINKIIVYSQKNSLIID